MSNSSTIDRHEEFWYDDGNLILLIDNVYFKVHRDVLARKAGLFNDLLSIPAEENSTDGNSIENPLRIPDISHFDFAVVLCDIYGLAPYSSLMDGSHEESARIIRVAQRLQATGTVVKLATKLMSELPPLARLSLCRELEIDEAHRSAASAEAARQSRAVRSAGHRDPQTEPDSKPQAAVTTSTDPPIRDILLFNAFRDVVLDFNLRLPFTDANWPLDDWMKVHLATAREQLIDGRRQKVLQMAKSTNGGSFRSADLAFCSTVGTLSGPVLRTWPVPTVQGYTLGIIYSQAGVQTWSVPEHEELAVIQAYWQKLFPVQS